MATSFFAEKEKAPTADEVRIALKKAAPLWEALVQKISDAGVSLGPEWKFYSKKSG